MDGGLLSLKWNNHRSTFFYVLSNVRKKECYTDVTLACDGKFYPVHKLILSTCSEYFEQMFEQTQCKHPVIVLKDIRSEELESLLSYMYVGEVNVVQEKLSGLIKAAECLRIKGLAVPDEEPQSNKSSGGSREKRTSDNSLSSESKRRRQDDGAFSSQKQTSSNSSREDSNRRRVDQSSSNKLNRNNASSSSSSGSLNSRESRESVSEQTSNKRDAVQTDEHLPSAASEAGDDEIELKAEEPPDAEEDLPPEMPSSDAADAVKQEPIDLDAVYLSDSNSASESKDMLVEDTFGEADGQQHFMDELLGQNSASDQHGGVGDYGEGGEGSSSSGAPSNQQQQHMVCGTRATSSSSSHLHHGQLEAVSYRGGSAYQPVGNNGSSSSFFASSLPLTTPCLQPGENSFIKSSWREALGDSSSSRSAALEEAYAVDAGDALGGCRKRTSNVDGSAAVTATSHHQMANSANTSDPSSTLQLWQQPQDGKVVPFDELPFAQLLVPSSRCYSCPLCHLEFSDKRNFRHHYMVHSGERPYPCAFCPYKARQTGTLNKHIKLKHPDAATLFSTGIF